MKKARIILHVLMLLCWFVSMILYFDKGFNIYSNALVLIGIIIGFINILMNEPDTE